MHRLGGGGGVAHCSRFLWSVSISKALESSLQTTAFSNILPRPSEGNTFLWRTHRNATGWTVQGITTPMGRSQAGFSQDRGFMAVPHSLVSVLCIFTSYCCFLQRFTLRLRWVQSSPSTSYLAAYLFNPGLFPCVLVG